MSPYFSYGAVWDLVLHDDDDYRLDMAIDSNGKADHLLMFLQTGELEWLSKFEKPRTAQEPQPGERA
jgi:hypothetical protein